VLKQGEPPHQAWPRVASAGGAGIGSASGEMDPVEGLFQGDATSAAVRRGRSRDGPRCLRNARGGTWEAPVAPLQDRHDRLLSFVGQELAQRPFDAAFVYSRQCGRMSSVHRPRGVFCDPSRFAARIVTGGSQGLPTRRCRAPAVE
jgi:hypothetical protein